MAHPNVVRSFYDRFAHTTLVRDFRKRNLRQVRIIDLCHRFIPANAHVLEVGCGVGIVSKAILSHVQTLIGVDISAENVQIARRYVDSPKATFDVVDITEGDSLESRCPFHAIVLPDVIEHIPKPLHRRAFAVLERLLHPEGVVLLTFPSPEYQRYLKERHPEELQVVDETIEIRELLDVTALRPRYCSYVDVWGRNQYVHLVLDRARSYRHGVPRKRLERARQRLSNRMWQLKNAAFLRKLSNSNR